MEDSTRAGNYIALTCSTEFNRRQAFSTNREINNYYGENSQTVADAGTDLLIWSSTAPNVHGPYQPGRND